MLKILTNLNFSHILFTLPVFFGVSSVVIFLFSLFFSDFFSPFPLVIMRPVTFPTANVQRKMQKRILRNEDGNFWKETGMSVVYDFINELVQERRNSSALAMDLHLPCTNPSLCAELYFGE